MCIFSPFHSFARSSQSVCSFEPLWQKFPHTQFYFRQFWLHSTCDRVTRCLSSFRQRHTNASKCALHSPDAMEVDPESGWLDRIYRNTLAPLGECNGYHCGCGCYSLNMITWMKLVTPSNISFTFKINLSSCCCRRCSQHKGKVRTQTQTVAQTHRYIQHACSPAILSQNRPTLAETVHFIPPRVL